MSVSLSRYYLVSSAALRQGPTEAQSDFELTETGVILLSPASQCWDCKHESTCLNKTVIFKHFMHVYIGTYMAQYTCKERNQLCGVSFPSNIR